VNQLKGAAINTSVVICLVFLCCAISTAQTIDHSSGFASHGDLTANGNALFAGSLARLTDGGYSERGSIFSNQPVCVLGFNTSFQLHLGDVLNGGGDGLTFTLQSTSPLALGGQGGALGYAFYPIVSQPGIDHSVAIKFDLFNNDGESDNSTGLFVNGHFPSVPGVESPAQVPPELNLPMDSSLVNLHNDLIIATINYDGSNLTENISDQNTNMSITHSYPVKISAFTGGNAYVGFTGGTGGFTSIQDVENWTFASTPCNICPHGLGFWKRHVVAWPVDTLTIGGQSYTKSQLQAILNSPVRGDASLILAKQLIPALLNGANGSNLIPINSTIDLSNTLLNGCNLGCAIQPSSPAGRSMTKTSALLESYNEGLLTPGCNNPD
jgi:hypothetical protein